jgi:tetratricopeptide (TPR) repeat protein
MRAGRFIGTFLLALLICAAGCSRDPNVRKQKYMESGNKYYEQGKFAEAAIQFANAVQVDPNFADAHYRLAETYARRQQWQQAFASLRKTVDLQPSNVKARIDLGNLLLASRNLDDARAEAEHVLAIDSNNADGHALMANILSASKQQPQALEEMQKAIAIAPGRSQLYQNLALLQVNSGDSAAGEQSLKKAAELDPKSSTPLIVLASLYERLNRFADAESSLRSAIQVQPSELGPRVGLARLLQGQHKSKEAEEVLRQAQSDLKQQPDAYRLLAEFYLSTGDLDRAATEFEALIKNHPDDLKLSKEYIPLLVSRNRLDDAERLNAQLLSKNAQDLEGLIYRGEILNRRAKPVEAQKSLQDALKMDPGNLNAHFQLGLAMAAQHNMEGAESEWQAALKIRPDFVPAIRAMAGVAMEKGDVKELARTAGEVIRLQPGNPEGYLLRSAAEINQRDFPAAERDILKLMELAPNSAMGYSRLGTLRAIQKKDAEAAKLFEQALSKDPNAIDALQGIATLSMRANQPAKALTRIDEQLAKAPANARMYQLKGLVLASMRNFSEAATALQKAMDLDPGNATAVLALGQVEASSGNIDKAIATYQTQIHGDSRDARFYFLIGSLEESRGNKTRAQEMYQKSLQADSSYALSANNLAFMMLDGKQNVDVAVSLAQVARQGLPELPNTADTLGWAYYQKGVYGLAVDLLEQAVAKAPENAGYQYHLGLAYAKRNNSAKAKMHLQKALSIDPKSGHSEEIKQMLQTVSSTTGG